MPATDRAGTRDDVVHVTPALAEADRLMTVCNACRYCEGLCAVFPAMEMRRAFPDGDLNYLAHLCHACGACYYDCQFAPPHEFDVNVPNAFAIVRAESYSAYAWPRACAALFERNGLVIAIAAALSVAAFIAGFVAWHDPAVLFGVHKGPGAFYRLMPHGAMAALFGAAFLYAIVAIAMGARMFWRDIHPPLKGEGRIAEGDPGRGREPRATPSRLAALADHPLLGGRDQRPRGAGISLGFSEFWRAIADTCTLRYLDGGGVGCFNDDDRPHDARRLHHHLTFYGFMLCFAATCVATLYHYGLGRQAPYPWYDLPVVLGTVGGLGLLIGPIGLLAAKWRRDPALADEPRYDMDAAFIAMLFLTSVTGLALLLLRETAAMGFLLALHLGVVFGFFVTLPYGRFVHGVYRFLALVRYAAERRAFENAGESDAAPTISTGQGGTRP
jgi:citrate/tricarballylate utilization protein